MPETIALETNPGEKEAPAEKPLSRTRFLVALDASDHANRALAEALAIAASKGAITGIHAYAAKLHDRRFRQMEGGLPERFLEEEEMEFQREVHDDLITRGLSIISDSYHDVAAKACKAAGARAYFRLSPEGKNYRRIIEAVDPERFDVLALGAVGLGAVPGGMVGTVCERVVRRSPIDTLVIRDPARAIGEGPIVACIDGSSQSFAGLRIALELGRQFSAPVHAIAAYDPYYHYVAFNRIAGVLSEEAGKVFRFKEQEKLHEELIDEGIAKIYQSHLDVARRMTDGAELVCELLDGKPHKAIREYLERTGASLAVLGKTGIHADPDLDIGGNTENLLRTAPCQLWLTQREHEPPLDIVAEETIAWSREAEEKLNRAPEFARGMARKAVLRLAQAKGHTFITTEIVDEVANQLMPGRQAPERREVTWGPEAEALVAGLEDQSLAGNIRLRAEKRARRENSEKILAEHVQPFLDGPLPPTLATTLDWTAEALARLARVPESMAERTKARIEAIARSGGASGVDLEAVEAGLVEARKAMEEAMRQGGHPGSAEPAPPKKGA
ncbi:MAG: universal stress protein [Alphaproteobacteria bacterium]